MKVYISVDMEGIAGVVQGEHTKRNGKEHERARMLMTEEANAAIKGALEAGAKEILVNDSHDTMCNIYPETLHPKAKLIMGSSKVYGMMEGLDSSFDAAIFIGYHTMSGTHGVLSHTYGHIINSIKINGMPMGEFGINSFLAGYYNVPSVFISGCNLTIAEAKTNVPNVFHAEVKRSISHTSAENLHPTVSRELIENGVKESLLNKDTVTPYRLNDTDQYEVVITFINTGLADTAETFPVVKRIDPLSVEFSSDNISDTYRMINGILDVVY